MATSPNFGWLEPDNTDLVKNGALAIRTAINGVDASLADLKGGTTGQVLSKTSNTDMDFTWVAQDDSNAIQNTQLTAKGALISAFSSATPATVTVGTNGQVLSADSTTATGLAWTTPATVPTSYGFTAGKNKIINGDFGIWQRGTSFTSSGVYTADRFLTNTDAGVTVSQQAFTAGSAPVAGYEGQYFLRWAKSAGGSFMDLAQRIEDVRTFAGQTVTLSFWAKVSSGTASVEPYYVQDFGTGGSGAVAGALTAQTINTTWTRYSFNLAVPSVAGKTIGTSSRLQISPLRILTASAVTADIWGVQLEAGSAATPFQTATGTFQGELAACQRYFIRIGGNKIYEVMGLGYTDGTTETYASRILPVTMRTTPSTTFATASLFRMNAGGGTVATGTGIGQDGNASSPNLVNFYLQYSSTGAAGRGAAIQANNSTSATMDISAEL
jgi:hypothetical protein